MKKLDKTMQQQGEVDEHIETTWIDGINQKQNKYKKTYIKGSDTKMVSENEPTHWNYLD